MVKSTNFSTRFLILSALICLTGISNELSASATSDSLLSLMNNAKADSSKFRFKIQWAQAEGINRIGFWDSLRTESSSKRLTSLEAQCLNKLGQIYKTEGELQQSNEYYLQSLKIYESIGNIKQKAVTLMSIAANYQEFGDFQKAIELHQNAFTALEKINDKSEMANVLIQSGITLRKQDNTTKAIKSFGKSLPFIKESGGGQRLNLAYNNLAECYKIIEKYDSALIFYNNSLEMAVVNIDIQSRVKSLVSIGEIYELQGEDEKAKSNYYESIDIVANSDNNEITCEVLTALCAVELKTGNRLKAKEHGISALKLAQKTGSLELIRNAAFALSNVYQVEDDWENALSNYELFILMRDSVTNETNQKASIRQQTKYEFEKAQLIKEQQEKERIREEKEATQRRDNLQYSIILIGIIAVFTIVLMLGFLSVSQKVAEGIIFFAFLLFFEFLLVLTDPYVDDWTGGAPGYKLMVNAIFAAGIFPLHSFFERMLKRRLLKNKRSASKA